MIKTHIDEPDAGRERILIVDDEAMVAFDLADQCEAAGYSVLGPALTLNQGLEMIAADAPAAALLDINLRDELVWPLARELRERSVPIVFISANCNHPEIRDEFECATCLDKPVESGRLMSILAPLLESRKVS